MLLPIWEQFLNLTLQILPFFNRMFMKKYTCLFILIVAFQYAGAQQIAADLYAGLAHYQGDLQQKRFNTNGIGPHLGLGLSYRFNTNLAIRGAASYLKLKGSDAAGVSSLKDIPSRNLSFATSVWEAQAAVEYHFFNIEERSLSPYLFAGVAAFHFNPYAHDAGGNKVFLRSLATEGQGLSAYPDKKMYKNNQLAVPFGAGVKFALGPQWQLGFELGFRKLFTDYLDDVSGTYADSALLASARGPLAAAMAYRGREINVASPYPAEGAIRGNPKNKDWYYTTGIRLSYTLGGGNGNGLLGGRKGKTGCPANVY